MCMMLCVFLSMYEYICILNKRASKKYKNTFKMQHHVIVCNMKI